MKQDLYEQLTERKKRGEKLNWNTITKEELEELFENHSDAMIAALYEVSKSRVTTKRKKWDIKLINYTIENILAENSNETLLEALNQTAKERLLKENNIDTISIALTHYLFRNGPVENIHSEGKLSQKEMETINKFMVNRIAGLLNTMSKGEWLKIELLLNFYSLFGEDWDKPIPDTEELNILYSKNLK